MLNQERLTLRDPQRWSDTNDSYYLELYRKKMGLSSVLALCFTQSNERFHHWEAFGNRKDETDRVKIKFKRRALIEAIKLEPRLKYGEIQYFKISDIKARLLKKEELPFIKRWGYNHEREFRIIYESTEQEPSTFDFHVPLSCIEKITLSPWLSYSDFKMLQNELRRIKNCSELKIERSTLIGSKEWKKYGERAL